MPRNVFNRGTLLTFYEMPSNERFLPPPSDFFKRIGFALTGIMVELLFRQRGISDIDIRFYRNRNWNEIGIDLFIPSTNPFFVTKSRCRVNLFVTALSFSGWHPLILFLITVLASFWHYGKVFLLSMRFFQSVAHFSKETFCINESSFLPAARSFLMEKQLQRFLYCDDGSRDFYNTNQQRHVFKVDHLIFTDQTTIKIFTKTEHARAFLIGNDRELLSEIFNKARLFVRASTTSFLHCREFLPRRSYQISFILLRLPN